MEDEGQRGESARRQHRNDDDGDVNEDEEEGVQE